MFALQSDHHAGTNHEAGCAADIARVDGESCDADAHPRTGHCYALALELFAMRGCLKPTELIYWWVAFPSKATYGRDIMAEHKEPHPCRLRRPPRPAPLPRRHAAVLQGRTDRKPRMNLAPPANLRAGPRPAPLDRSTQRRTAAQLSPRRAFPTCGRAGSGATRRQAKWRGPRGLMGVPARPSLRGRGWDFAGADVRRSHAAPSTLRVRGRRPCPPGDSAPDGRRRRAPEVHHAPTQAGQEGAPP